MIYLDSSALLKLLVEETESAALALWISEQPRTPMVSSEVARVEVIRAARRLDEIVVPAARTLMAQIDLIPLRSGLIDQAADVGEPALRSLDAIHLASALAIRADLTTFVGYDQRLLDAVRSANLDINSPGATSGREPPADH